MGALDGSRQRAESLLRFMVLTSLARYSPRLLRVTGALLVMLGGIHLVATPSYMGWASTQIRPENAVLVAAGMRLNHILVGVLLLPLGLSTWWAARSLDEAWAFRQS